MVSNIFTIIKNMFSKCIKTLRYTYHLVTIKLSKPNVPIEQNLFFAIFIRTNRMCLPGKLFSKLPIISKI